MLGNKLKLKQLGKLKLRNSQSTIALECGKTKTRKIIQIDFKTQKFLQTFWRH